MIATSLLETFSNYTLIEDTPLLDIFRYSIAAMSALTTALLLRLWISHRSSYVHPVAGAGATATYAVVCWAQLASISGPNENLTLLNVAVFLAIAASLVGTIASMDITLFSTRHNQPTDKEAARDEIFRVGRMTDQINHAVNGRGPGVPTLSEDAQVSRLRDEAADVRSGIRDEGLSHMSADITTSRERDEAADAAAADDQCPVVPGAADRAAGATADAIDDDSQSSDA